MKRTKYDEQSRVLFIHPCHHQTAIRTPTNPTNAIADKLQQTHANQRATYINPRPAKSVRNNIVVTISSQRLSCLDVCSIRTVLSIFSLPPITARDYFGIG